MSVMSNKADPMLRSGPEAGRVLFETWARDANGFPREAVVDAAVNALVNSLRQEHTRGRVALAAFDELTAKAKGLLASHYDSVTGNRRNVFAHTQHVIMDTHKDPEGL